MGEWWERREGGDVKRRSSVRVGNTCRKGEEISGGIVFV